ncbi:ABC transporter ATP-binding protein [Lysinibacillus sphaericus]|uniref:ATP-binding cassette domain-containing protein n=1 Tax=Lysinibacillus TaxID=400634 RepID=UPI0025A0A42A|nr:ABC transporter ATP-binding protein [Lysinibacillus sphaericus]MDM5350037.1 ABC transporter ATP-binding protein [Lysinibacillus sphaericus]MEB7454630.1 ABC transporter ATP-binding protein [Lysinibacillus sphaericus]
MFKVDNLAVQLDGKSLIQGLTFTVPKGQITAIIGESGSGKSTTLSALLGMLPARATMEGSIVFNERNVMTMSEQERVKLRKKHFFTIFQDAMNSFSPTQKIKHQLYRLTASRLGQKEEEFLDKITAILKELNLPKDVLNRYPFELSGGMLQRCMLACAFYHEPDVLMADEPTSALDMLHQQEFIKLLKNLHARLGTTILLITHDLGVAKMADSILVMKNGEIVESGRMSEIFKEPKHPYTKQLVAHHF